MLWTPGAASGTTRMSFRSRSGSAVQPTHQRSTAWLPVVEPPSSELDQVVTR
ncbi:hypothetical protein AB0E59_15360 [Lentzea sp. NPDC034063]|uniref:hypothetical protein n=1 Tax=unclassified Lentzea TaxID=2643253 RepID=UPI0033F1D05F